MGWSFQGQSLLHHQQMATDEACLWEIAESFPSATPKSSSYQVGMQEQLGCVCVWGGVDNRSYPTPYLKAPNTMGKEVAQRLSPDRT